MRLIIEINDADLKDEYQNIEPKDFKINMLKSYCQSPNRDYNLFLHSHQLIISAEKVLYKKKVILDRTKT